MANDLLITKPIPGLQVVTLNRPEKLNALTHEMLTSLSEIARDCALTDTRIVLLTGSGKAFSSGGDITNLLNFNQDEVKLYLQSYSELDDAITQSKAVWIAAINGLAYGGGLEIATMCDLRIADVKSNFCVADIEVGALPTGGLTWRLPRMIGSSAATWMVIANPVVNAERSLQLGLIHEVVSSGSVMDRAIELAGKILGFHPEAIIANRMALRNSWKVSLQEARNFEVDESIALLANNEILSELKKRFAK